MIILGINAYHADAAANVVDGKLIAAVEEERCTLVSWLQGNRSSSPGALRWEVIMRDGVMPNER
jgi:predicted NodU family carbamoyl transferase